ncbi:hypothetical protein Gasu2_68870 [Galdieria sulphuraria]|nr:hypothetical protein Gasu2_68870 [Galdieria sulphuraria]
MGCIHSKVPVEQVSESSLSFSLVESVREPVRAVLERNRFENTGLRSFGNFQRTLSVDEECNLDEERYFQAKLKVEAWFARSQAALEKFFIS